MGGGIPTQDWWIGGAEVSASTPMYVGRPPKLGIGELEEVQGHLFIMEGPLDTAHWFYQVFLLGKIQLFIMSQLTLITLI